MERYAKAIAALAVPVFSSLLLWASTGTLNVPELALGLAGLFAGVVVYLVPNNEIPRIRSTKSIRTEKGEDR